MSTVEAFRSGFHDGWAHEKRKRNQGGIYLRAYKKGEQARDRNDNGGEEVNAHNRRAVRVRRDR
jgi:hypothetical protein